MRSAEDLKARWLAEIPLMLDRAGMWSSTGREADTLYRRLLEDLRFLDEHDPAVIVRERQGYGATGIDGAIRAVLGDGVPGVAEVASVYAELFHRHGYLEIAPVEWGPLAEAARAGLGDLRRDELEAVYGEPSLVVDRRVACYASADGWLFVDYHGPELIGPQVRVRNVRVPAARFDDGVFFTPYGRRVVGGGL